MTKEQTAARLFEIVRDMTPASAAARRSLAALSARLLRGDELDGIELLNSLMTAGAALDPLDVMTRGELDRLYKDIAVAVNAAQAKEAKPARKIDDPIMIRWQTGHIEIYPAEFFRSACILSKLKQLVSLAEIDRTESLDAIRAYLENAREAARHRKDRKEAARFTSLLEIVGPGPVKKTPVIRAAERVINSLCAREKETSPRYRDFGGAWMSGGKQCVCDGYRLIRFNDPLPLPAAEGDGLDAEKAMEAAKRNTKPLELPTAKDLKALIKIAKANSTQGGERWTGRIYRSDKKVYCYDFGEFLPGVNASFLVDMLEALPGCKAYYETESGGIYFTAENGDGMLLPIRKDHEKLYHAQQAA